MKHLYTSLLLLSVCFSQLHADVPRRAEDAKVLEVGTEAPDPDLTTVEGKSVSLGDLRKDKPTVLVFYRGGWCPYCNRQLADLQKALPELGEKGWRMIAVSPDKAEELNKTIKEQKLGYTLVSDSEMKAAKAFGVAFQVDPATVGKYQEYGIDLVKASGQKHRQLPVPSVFLIDEKGKITFVYSNPDYKTRLSNEKLLKAAAGE